jgi:uncharacterized protein YceH (UPF0502 family)
MESNASCPPPLSASHARILGSLIEKEAATPEAYPLTANAVQVACNQKTSRDPVMALEAGEVGHALRQLESQGLVKSIHGARAQRYEHRFAQCYSVTGKQQALLCVLLLRGAQTAMELHNRCDRLAEFADADEVRQTLERLQQRTPALVQNIGRGAGQREDRYMHLLAGPIDAEGLLAALPRAQQAPAHDDLQARVDALEARVDALQSELALLRARLGADG